MTKHRIFVILCFAVFCLPVAVLVIYSASSQWTFPRVLPSVWSFRAAAYVRSQIHTILYSIFISLLYSMTTVIASFLICLFPASAFARHNFRGKQLIESMLLAPALVPAITFSMGVHYVFIRFGIADTIGGVILVLTIFSYPYMLRALTAGFLAYGEGYTICAKNLGANMLTRVFRVELALLLPSIISGGTVVFLVSFSEYFLVFLIGGGVVPSFTGYLFPFLNSADRSVASLLTLMFLVIPIVLFILIEMTVQRIYRNRGLISE